jgi:hypothetical protein
MKVIFIDDKTPTDLMIDCDIGVAVRSRNW